MGQLVYGGGTAYEFEDRTLAHVKVAVGTKLRRQESFYLSWIVPSTEGSGRVSIWLSSSIALRFHFREKHPTVLNREWIKALEMTAMSDRGMVVLDEADAEAYVNDNPPSQPTK